MSKIICQIWVCTDCMQVHFFGDSDSDDETAECVPLSAIPDDHTITGGLFDSDHDDNCGRDGNCNCGRREFSRSQCEGCGSDLHGTRYAMTLWDERQ